MVQEGTARATQVSRESGAYRSGWEDGRFGDPVSFATNPNIGAWADAERLSYYRGHREGRRVREMLGVSVELARVSLG